MGCTQSRIENEEAVLRCKERKLHLKEAVSERNAFAAAHSAYVIALKNTGAALSDYAHGEAQNLSDYAHGEAQNPNSIQSNPSQVNDPDTTSQLPYETLRPPPLPPDYSAPARAASLPANLPKAVSKPVVSTIEEDEEEENELENEGGSSLKHRSSKGKSGGSVGNTSRINSVKEEARNEDNVGKNPDSVPAAKVENPYYDFIFPSVENVPGSTLTEAAEEAGKIDSNQIESKGFDERPKRVENEIEGVVKPEKVAEQSRVQTVVAGGGGGGDGALVGTAGGKSVNKGKGDIGRVERKWVPKADVNMVQIFMDLDEDFLKAYESAHEVLKMLEATRLHYHSNFADNRGHIDHSARVMRVITWNRSFRGLPNNDNDGKDDDDSEEHETHATVLDKLLAWEKKLYDEVKAGELLKFDYQRKVAMLNKQKKRNSNSESLEKTKAAVCHLHTRYIVDMQSMDSTVLEINRLRDQQLYVKLVQLVGVMSNMWKTMKSHHESQLMIVLNLRFLDINQSTKETTEHHYDRTYQLFNVVKDWHLQLASLLGHQKEYIKALNKWLKFNVIPIESNLNEKVASPPRSENPPIRTLVNKWSENMETLPDEDAKSAIFNFHAVLETLVHHQADELKWKAKCEETRRELAKRDRQYKDWCQKYEQRRTSTDDTNPVEDERLEVAAAEKEVAIELLKRRLEEEEETYRRMCIQVREKTLASFKIRMPELFKAMVKFAEACTIMYSNLALLAEPETFEK